MSCLGTCGCMSQHSSGPLRATLRGPGDPATCPRSVVTPPREVLHWEEIWALPPEGVLLNKMRDGMSCFLRCFCSSDSSEAGPLGKERRMPAERLTRLPALERVARDALHDSSFMLSPIGSASPVDQGRLADGQMSFLLSEGKGLHLTGARAGDFEERMALAELRMDDASLAVSVAEATICSIANGLDHAQSVAEDLHQRRAAVRRERFLVEQLRSSAEGQVLELARSRYLSARREEQEEAASIHSWPTASPAICLAVQSDKVGASDQSSQQIGHRALGRSAADNADLASDRKPNVEDSSWIEYRNGVKRLGSPALLCLDDFSEAHVLKEERHDADKSRARALVGKFGSALRELEALHGTDQGLLSAINDIAAARGDLLSDAGFTSLCSHNPGIPSARTDIFQAASRRHGSSPLHPEGDSTSSCKNRSTDRCSKVDGSRATEDAESLQRRSTRFHSRSTHARAVLSRPAAFAAAMQRRWAQHVSDPT